jgi:predicted nuclease with TOPRIM domain
MPVQEKQIQGLLQKFQLLVKKHQSLEKENIRLVKEVTELKERLSAVKKESEIFEMQNAMLKAGSDQLDEKEKKDMEKKLNFYIAEIDRCISVLSR